MFEITGDDIAALNDSDLRTLIGRLCEAELRRKNLPASAVTYGGSQTAKDGGLDVRVTLAPGRDIEGFIPRPSTGYQVKKPDMPPSEITKEMKPKGVLRPVFSELAAVSGAYVIVSSAASTSDAALKSRKEAMAQAVKAISGSTNLLLDFYDRNRIATWVRDHAGLIPWVRSKVGKSISGWRSYGRWSDAPEGANSAYLSDQEARIKANGDQGESISVIDGLNRIRNILRDPGHIVRLVGLSGVGKTRFAEALFESEIGTNPLDSSLAIYTNIAEGPDPQPGSLAADLIAHGARAILIVDNCQPEVHRQLSEIVRSDGTTISAITIEYDIREDQPEGTEVFSLEASSPALIEKLLSKRFPDLSQVDTRSIADFSGGNARVALALAGTVQKTETIAGLTNDELFRRLFYQRHDPDSVLLSIAQACSLVYSFDGENLSGDDSELPILSGLVGKTAEQVFAAVAELKRRDLVQARGNWRAVLPHAIANRLAALGLENIPRALVLARLVDGGSERLIKSFSRRLGYLDTSKEAQEIVHNWLSPGGLLGDVARLNTLGQSILANVAPVLPADVLTALEAALFDANDDTLGAYVPYTRLLRSLAYGAEHFDRAASLLARLAILPPQRPSDNKAAEAFTSLFYILLSGTHAPLGARLKVIDVLLRSTKEAENALGLKALQSALHTGHFSSHFDFEFGARSRDYGYRPGTSRETISWFREVLRFAEPFALSHSAVGEGVRTSIASAFRGLWRQGALKDDLEHVAKAIARNGFWSKGWRAARQTRLFDGKSLSKGSLSRLVELEEFLRPQELADQVRGVVLGSVDSLDIEDMEEVENKDYARAAKRTAELVEALGRKVAADDRTFRLLLPELLRGTGRIVDFGKGFGDAEEKPREVWAIVVRELASAPKADVNVGFLCGFLSGVSKRDNALASSLLDEALDHPSLAEWSVTLQSSVVIDEGGINRLRRALELGRVPINRFSILGYGRMSDVIPAGEFKDLLLAIGKAPGGNPVAIDILHMRLYSYQLEKKLPEDAIVETGRELLLGYEFRSDEGPASRTDHEVAALIATALSGGDGEAVARHVGRSLVMAAASDEVNGWDQGEVMEALFRVHPVGLLNELFSGEKKMCEDSVQLLKDLLQFGKRPMDTIPDDILIRWCDRDQEFRYPLVMRLVSLFSRKNENAPYQWTSIAIQLLRSAPDPVSIFEGMIQRFYPRSWSGSLAVKLDERLKLLSAPNLNSLALPAESIEKAKAELRRRITLERRFEQDEGRTKSERFE